MSFMRLFHQTTTEAAALVLRDGFKDRSDPKGTNLGFYNQIPEIKAVWFRDIPANSHGSKLLLLEIPDEVAQQVDKTVRLGLWGRSSLVAGASVPHNTPQSVEEVKPYQEYIIPAEIANQYGPPTDITNLTDLF